MTTLLHKQLTHTIIGVYYEVYNALASAYPEDIYENAFMLALQDKGLECRQQVEYQVFYKDRLVGIQRLDILVDEKIILELKVASQLTKLHKAQTLSYLKTSGKSVGLLFNFGSAEPEFERLYFAKKDKSKQASMETTPAGDLDGGYLHPELTGKIIAAIYEVHSSLGPGFIHRIYANSLHHELRLSGLTVLAHRSFRVFYREQPVGEIKLNHLQIEDLVLVFPVAIQELQSLKIDNLKTWMRTQNIPLGIIANFYPSSAEIKILRI